jgi:serine/threonine-protein kinase
VPGLGAEAAAAAAAMATHAMPYAAEATQAMPATELVPGGLGAATMTGDPTAFGLPPADGPDAAPKKPNRAPVFVLLALAAIAAVVLLLVFGPKLFGGNNVTQVTVPPLTQSTQAEAQATLTRLGLKAVVQPAPNDDPTTKGQVTAQDPVAGTKVDPGATVTITVSTGPDTVQVPDVSGMTKDDATAALKAVGLTVSTTDTVESAAQDAGKVIGSDPAAGKTVNRSSSVALHLASGKATVPNVVGLDNVTAANKLTAAGFKVKQVLAPSDAPAGQVTAQDHAGDVLKRGQTVTLTVSNGTPTSTPTDTPTGTPTDTPTG